MVQLIILILAFVLLSGLMALTEAAVLSVTHAEVEVMVQGGERGATSLQKIKKRITDAVVIIVVFTNVVNVLGPVLVGTRAVEIYGSTAIGVVTAVLTLGTIVFSEIIPKSLGTHYAPRISRLVAPPLRLLIIVFYPVVWLFEKLTSAMKSGERRVGTEDQIRSLAKLGHNAGYIETDETQLVHRVFELNDRLAGAIMTPLESVVTVGEGMTVREAALVMREAAFTRYPVVDADGRVVGVVISHELLQELIAGRDNESISGLIRDPLTVPASAKADDLLALFRAEHFHMAIVERRGSAVGIVTLEDVLEELVGEIEDEMDE